MYGLFNNLIGGTMGLVNGIMQNNANRVNTQNSIQASHNLLNQQQQYNRENAQIAYENQRSLWYETQSPQAMVANYQAAGLNPALLYGMSGPSGNMPNVNMAQTASPTAMPVAQTTPILNAEVAKTFAEIAKLAAEKNEIEVRTEGEEKDLPIKDQMLENLKQERQESQQRIAVMQQDIQKKFAETMNEYQKHNNLKAEEELTKAKADYENAMTALANMKLEWEPKKYTAQIKEMNAKAAEAYAAAKKFNAEAETENQCRQFIVKNIKYAAEEQAYRTLYLQPEEYQLLKNDIESVILANDKEKGVLEAYGKWKRKANHDRILEILNFCASASKAEAANKVGNASLINAAGTAVKAVPK